MSTFSRTVSLPASTAEAFAWHERPGALDRLIPPWEHVQIEKRGSSLRPGEQVILKNRIGGVPVRWVAEHVEYDPGHSFRDVQLSGPFARWDHSHLFSDETSDSCLLKDEIEYDLPGGSLGSLLGSQFAREKIQRMFEYRHATTAADLRAHRRGSERQPMRWLVSGSTGLVGSALRPFLTTGGHEVVSLTRSPDREVPLSETVGWKPKQGEISEIPGEVDAVVHLAGENIAGGRWNDRRKRRIMESRVEGTRVLAETLARMERRPKVLVCASATGYYGDRGSELVDERAAAGADFLADVARQWEAAAEPARQAGIRVVHLRFGMILSPRGGALAKLLTPFQFGGGGRIGSGEQYWSWITIDDVVDLIHFAALTESLEGPVNAVSPEAVTCREFVRVLGRVLHRPSLVPLPAAAARLALGEMADALLLTSCRALPTKALEAGYQFRHPQLDSAFRHLLGRT